MGLNEIAIIIIIVVPFIYEIINCKYKYEEKKANRYERRHKNK